MAVAIWLPVELQRWSLPGNMLRDYIATTAAYVASSHGGLE